MPMTTAFAHSCIGVSDLDRALGVYRDGLGLAEVQRSQTATGTVLVLLGCNAQDAGGLIELAWRQDRRSNSCRILDITAASV